MGKITEALKKVDEERLDKKKQNILSAAAYSKEGQKMKNSWLVWLFIMGFVITIFVAFNSQKEKDTIPLTEIFPDEEVVPVDVEYEFVESDVHKADNQNLQKAEKTNVVTVKDIPVKKKEILKKVEAQPKSKGVYTVQLASFKTENRAQKILEELNKKGYSSAYIISKNLGTKGTWYRVYVGNFENKMQASEFLAKIKPEYKSSFIIKR